MFFTAPDPNCVILLQIEEYHDNCRIIAYRIEYYKPTRVDAWILQNITWK